HTRSKRDWSSDVCSSDLERSLEPLAEGLTERLAEFLQSPGFDAALGKYVELERWVEEGVERPELERAVRAFIATQRDRLLHDERSEERRVGKGWRARGGR